MYPDYNVLFDLIPLDDLFEWYDHHYANNQITNADEYFIMCLRQYLIAEADHDIVRSYGIEC